MLRRYLPWHHHPGHPEVVVPSRVDPLGRHGPTRKAAEGGRWRSLGSGWFVPVDVDSSTPDQRIVEAAVRLTEYGAVTGWAALHWMGATWFDGSGHVPCSVVLATGDAGIRPSHGIHVVEERLLPHDIVVVDGLRVTVPARSTLYEMRYAADEGAAVTVLDMACFSDLVSIEQATEYAELLGTWTGIPQARAALPLANENAWSPTEVGSRILWTREGGLPRPLTNTPIFDREGKHLVTPDLLDPVAGVVGEYDGDVHLARGARWKDVRRDELYRRLGLEPVIFMAPDLHDPGPAVRRLHEAYDRAGARPQTGRSWTVEAPSWWKSTLTVADRRALAPPDRARLLRHRRPDAA